MRPGAEYFTAPSGAGQRRYEALRAYFLEEATAAQVAQGLGTDHGSYDLDAVQAFQTR